MLVELPVPYANTEYSSLLRQVMLLRVQVCREKTTVESQGRRQTQLSRILALQDDFAEHH